MKVENCIFCKIVKKELPAKIVYEDDEVLAFHDIHPVATVHILIIPKKHIELLAKVTEEDEKILGKIQMAAKVVAEKMGVLDGFRLATASGAKVGQTVFHMHYHLIGGWKGKSPRIWNG